MNGKEIASIYVNNLDSDGGPVQIKVNASGRSVGLYVRLKPESNFGFIEVIMDHSECDKLVNVLNDAVKGEAQLRDKCVSVEVHDTKSQGPAIFFLRVVSTGRLIHFSACLPTTDFELILSNLEFQAVIGVLSQAVQATKNSS